MPTLLLLQKIFERMAGPMSQPFGICSLINHMSQVSDAEVPGNGCEETGLDAAITGSSTMVS